MYLTTEDKKNLKTRIKQKKKNPSMCLLIATKKGSNATGKGASRSVILGTWDRDEWFQAEKFWGKDNEDRAEEFINEFNSN